MPQKKDLGSRFRGNERGENSAARMIGVIGLSLALAYLVVLGSALFTGQWLIDAQGRLLGKILVPWTVSNLAFGGRNRCRLFICASHTLMAIFTNVRGAVRP